MSLELRPLGVSCNLACRYCYQQPQRDAGNFRQPYDLDRMKAAAAKGGGPFVLFGGEPLLLPVADLEELWRWGFERYGRNSVQTNGVLVGDEHMRLFRQYNVDVGVSVDGPAELNDARQHRAAGKTRAATAKVHDTIARLAREWRPPGVIVTLHRGNAVAEHLPRMAEWVRELDALGVRGVRLHLLEVEDDEVRAELVLSARENVAAVRFFTGLQRELKSVRFDLVEDMTQLLRGRDGRASCVWGACDPYTTPAVQGVEGNGQSSNCGRTNKDGVDFTKADAVGYERYLMLHQTPREHGGCRGCRFFLMCKGQCPGTAVDGDWRNRTEHCDIWTELFTGLEADLVRAGEVPLSLSPSRERVEAAALAAWAEGRSARLEVLTREPAAQGAA